MEQSTYCPSSAGVAGHQRGEDAHGGVVGGGVVGLVALAVDGRGAGGVLRVVAVHVHGASGCQRDQVGDRDSQPRDRPCPNGVSAQWMSAGFAAARVA